jgi:O-antigen/teichoic acid export membrane protein
MQPTEFQQPDESLRQAEASHPRPGLARNVARNTTVQFVGQGLSKLASLALYVVVARVLGVRLFGDLVFALSISALMTGLAGFGIEGVVMRGVARDHERARRLLAESIVLKLPFGLIGVGAATTVAFLGSYRSDVRTAVIVLSVGSVVDLIAANYFAIFQAMGDLLPASVCIFVQRSIGAVLGIVLVLSGAGVAVLSFAFFTASVCALVIVAVWLARRGITPARRPKFADVRSLGVRSFPLGVNNMFSTILFRADATMLSLMKGNFAVGLYGVAYRLLESTLFISYTFTAALVPALAKLRRDTEPSSARVYELGNAVLALLLVPIGDFLVAFPHLIVSALYGSRYHAADTVMRLLGGAAVLYGFAYLAAWAVFLADRDRVLPWVNGLAAAQNVGMNLAIIPPLSYDGAAISTTVCEATRTVLLMFYAVRSMGPIRLGRILLAPCAGSLAILGVALGAGVGVVGFVAAAVAYAICVGVLELVLFPADARALRTALSQRRVPAPGLSASA